MCENAYWKNHERVICTELYVDAWKQEVSEPEDGLKVKEGIYTGKEVMDKVG